jgi:hypothetical protein
VEFVEHVTDDTLEHYAMRTLPPPESECLEEHLLICSTCRDRLTATDEYEAAMNAEPGVWLGIACRNICERALRRQPRRPRSSQNSPASCSPVPVEILYQQCRCRSRRRSVVPCRLHRSGSALTKA